MYPNDPSNNNPGQAPAPFPPQPPTPPPSLQPTPQPAPQPSDPFSYQQQQPATNPFAAAPQPAVQPPVQPYAPTGLPTAEQPPVTHQPQPVGSPFPAAPAHSNNNMTMMLIAAGIVVLALVGGGIWWFTSSGGNPLSSITGGGDVVSRSDGTLDLSTLVDTQKDIKAQDIKAKLNQQVNLADGLSYMVTKVERNWQTDSVYLQPKAGKELIRISLVVGNKAKEGNSYISSSLFRLKNSAGGLQTAEFPTKEEDPELLEGDDVAPGKQVKGTVIFEVDKDEKVLFATTQDYQNYSTNEKVTIASEVTLE